MKPRQRRLPRVGTGQGSGVFKWGTRKDNERTVTPAPDPARDSVARSKVMPKFVAALAGCSSPVVLDLGPVVGSNVAFFGERLACKLHVEDLFVDVEAHARRRAKDPAADPPALASRLVQSPESVDGILCWDLFDYLDGATARALAARLTGLLRSGGALHGLFGTTPIDLAHYTRFVLEEEAESLRHRTYPATPAQRHVLTSRDITRIFNGLELAESVLLRSSAREMLFCKP